MEQRLFNSRRMASRAAAWRVRGLELDERSARFVQRQDFVLA